MNIEEKEQILNKLLEQNNKLVSTIDQQKEQINQLIKTNENNDSNIGGIILFLI